jgi:putative DNA primase/helicase
LDRAGQEPNFPEGLNDRAKDNWEPLFGIADLIGGKWPIEAREAALLLSGESSEVEDGGDLGVALLSDIRQLFKHMEAEEVRPQEKSYGRREAGRPPEGGLRIAADALVIKLNAMLDRPWPTANRGGKPLDQRHLSRLLKAFKISPKQIRLFDKHPSERADANKDRRVMGYLSSMFEDAFKRYLPPFEEYLNQDEG